MYIVYTCNYTHTCDIEAYVMNTCTICTCMWVHVHVVFVCESGTLGCGESWLTIKDHHPSSQGWAPRCPIHFAFACLYCSGVVFCD